MWFPGVHRYVYPLPPPGLAVTAPLFRPHVVAVPLAVVVIPVELPTMALAVAVHPPDAVTVTLYVPAPKLFTVWLEWFPGVQRYVYPLPPLGLAVTVPSFSPQVVCNPVALTVNEQGLQLNPLGESPNIIQP